MQAHSTPGPYPCFSTTLNRLCAKNFFILTTFVTDTVEINKAPRCTVSMDLFYSGGLGSCGFNNPSRDNNLITFHNIRDHMMRLQTKRGVDYDFLPSGLEFRHAGGA